MDRDQPRPREMPGMPCELLRAALEDVAPSEVRRGVLAALGMAAGDSTDASDGMAGGDAPHARPGEVTTSSGVFEKGPSPSQRTSAPTPRPRIQPMTSSCAEQPVTLSCVGLGRRGAPDPSHPHPADLPLWRQHATSLLYLAAAAAAGSLIAKAAHVGLTGGALSLAALSGVRVSEGALAQAELVSGSALTCDSRWSSQDMTRETRLSAEATASAQRGRAGAPSRKARRAERRPASRQNDGVTAFREHLSVDPGVSGGEQAASFAGQALSRVASMESTDTAAAVHGEDWLGEQLAILARAERSLLEDDPDATLRSFEDYRARFPRGLLDLQMAAVRLRAEQRFGAYFFP